MKVKLCPACGSHVHLDHPIQGSECWEPTVHYTALHRKILAVATTRIEGTWCAYWVPVPGENHDEESLLWESVGVKMGEEMARLLFPRMSDVIWAN